LGQDFPEGVSDRGLVVDHQKDGIRHGAVSRRVGTPSADRRGDISRGAVAAAFLTGQIRSAISPLATSARQHCGPASSQ
jgi:hypothetical protein